MKFQQLTMRKGEEEDWGRDSKKNTTHQCLIKRMQGRAWWWGLCDEQSVIFKLKQALWDTSGFCQLEDEVLTWK